VKGVVTALVISLACLAGLWLVSVDARTDDTGIEAGLIVLVAAALSAIRPGASAVVALVVGAPIPIVEAMRGGGFPAGIAALGFSVAGALVGAYLGTIVRRSASSSRA
jgi:hypothetical protein